jgi:hypothetical protein
VETNQIVVRAFTVGSWQGALRSQQTLEKKQSVCGVAEKLSNGTKQQAFLLPRLARRCTRSPLRAQHGHMAFSLPEGARETYEAQGYITIPDFLTPAECDALEAEYDKLTHPTPELCAKMDCDFGDQSQRGFGNVKPEDFNLINVNNPGYYSPQFQKNPFIERATLAAAALIGEGVSLDYTQVRRCRRRVLHASSMWPLCDLRIPIIRPPCDRRSCLRSFPSERAPSSRGTKICSTASGHSRGS